jgi:hypothetical protein
MDVCHRAADIFSRNHTEANFAFGEEGVPHERFVSTGPPHFPEWRWRWELDDGHICVELYLAQRGPFVGAHRFTNAEPIDDFRNHEGRNVFWNWPQTYRSQPEREISEKLEKLHREAMESTRP